MAYSENADTLRRAIEAFETGDAQVFPELFAPDVSGWSPVMMVNGLDELVAAFSDFESSLSDIEVQIDAVDGFGNKALAEYRITGVFTQPFVVDDEVVIEPHGGTVVLGAAMVAEFEDGLITAYRNYFDDITIFDQMLTAG